eukprot:TRINITY_DN836_c0_g2_i5.p1 TRINITY_DN836_c0_g2~~TRINITY_DN836_c0_g2_i5.p1  ORF type:complete len:361 (+),score=96.60 TRINITY_DN836_c0_g2_i5:65-1147(+)
MCIRDSMGDITLGYFEQVGKENAVDLLPENFPSKAGGLPVWVDNSCFEGLKCSKCQKPLRFLLQIYCPTADDYAFHRTLFVFYCSEKLCKNQSSSFVVIRLQLSENFEIPKLEKALEGLDRPLKDEFIIETETTDPSEAKHIWDLVQNPDDEENEKDENYEKENKKLKAYEAEKDGEEDEDDWDDVDAYRNEVLDDKEFQFYTRILKISPNHVVRYVRDANSFPLWYHTKGKLNDNKSIPKCELCGSTRHFEFQINSTILNQFDEFGDYDWGVIAIYTCSRSCNLTAGPAREYAFVQLAGDEKEIDALEKLMSELAMKNPGGLEEVKESKSKKKRKKKAKNNVIKEEDEEEKKEDEDNWE